MPQPRQTTCEGQGRGRARGRTETRTAAAEQEEGPGAEDGDGTTTAISTSTVRPSPRRAFSTSSSNHLVLTAILETLVSTLPFLGEDLLASFRALPASLNASGSEKSAGLCSVSSALRAAILRLEKETTSTRVP